MVVQKKCYLLLELVCVVDNGSSSTIATGVEEKLYMARIQDEKLCFGLVMFVGIEKVVFFYFIGKENYNLFNFFSFFSFSFPFFSSSFGWNGLSYLQEVGKVYGLPSIFKYWLLIPLGRISTFDNKSTTQYYQTRLLKAGCGQCLWIDIAAATKVVTRQELFLVVIHCQGQKESKFFVLPEV